MEDQDLIPGPLKLSKAKYPAIPTYSPGSFTCVDCDIKEGWCLPQQLLLSCMPCTRNHPSLVNLLFLPYLYRPVPVIHCSTVYLTLELQHLTIFGINLATNMAKTKPNIDAHTNKSVATNVLFNNVGPEALHQRSRYMKKAIKVSKSKNEYKPRHAAIPENTLAAEFAGKVHQI